MKVKIRTDIDRQIDKQKQVMKMSDTDVRAWNRTTELRMREYEAVANAMLVSMLYVLATKRGHGPKRLREDWEWMIEARAEIRSALRTQEGQYELAATFKNVEDYYMREELRRRGCDVIEWERHVEMDDEGNVRFTDREERR